FREKTVKKFYFALVMGQWKSNCKVVNAPLLKNEVNSIVRVNPNGKPSETRFKILEKFEQATLIQASPITGRTHQIRVHTQYTGHPIA
ncbi:pseudouridine synthase, partial [Vibrio parahaemolyticus]